MAGLPERGQLSGRMSRFFLSLRGKHFAGVLNKISRQRYGPDFFALPLAAQIVVMREGGVRLLDEFERALTGAPADRHPAGTRLNISRSAQSGQPPHEQQSRSGVPPVNRVASDALKLVSDAKTKLADLLKNTLAGLTLRTYTHLVEVPIPQALARLTVREIATMPLAAIEMAANRDPRVLQGVALLLGYAAEDMRKKESQINCGCASKATHHPSDDQASKPARHNSAAASYRTDDTIGDNQRDRGRIAAKGPIPPAPPRPGRPPPVTADVHLSDFEVYKSIQESLQTFDGNPLLDYRLEHWVADDDKHFPQVFLRVRLRTFTYLQFSNIQATPGVGALKSEKLLAVLKKALAELAQDACPGLRRGKAGAGPPIHTPASTESVSAPCAKPISATPKQAAITPSADGLRGCEATEENWRRWTHVVIMHGLDGYPLGRLATSLQLLPHNLWEVPIAHYTRLCIREILELPGHGPSRQQAVLDVFGSIYRSLASVPINDHYKVSVMSAAMRDATAWIERVLTKQQVPDMVDMCQVFLQTLLSQLNLDLGSEARDMAERRLGLRGPRQSFDEIGRVYGLTSARISQVMGRAEEVFRVRWAEGRYFLDDLCDHLYAAGANEQRDFLCTVMNELMGLRYDGASKGKLLELQRRINGRSHSTATLESTLRSARGKQLVSPEPNRTGNSGAGIPGGQPEASRKQCTDPQAEERFDDLVDKILDMLG